MAHKSATHYDVANGKDLVYGIVLTEALNVLSEDKRRSKILADDYVGRIDCLKSKTFWMISFWPGIRKILMNIASGFIKNWWWKNSLSIS